MSEQPETAELSLEDAVERMFTVDEPAETEAQPEPQEAEPEAAEAEAEVETEEQGEPEAEPVFEIETVDGKQQLTLSQLKEGAMLKADYTRKTMALAEDRKAVEAVKSEVSDLKQRLSDALVQWAVPAQQEPDWAELAAKLPPQEFNRQRAMWDQRQKQAQMAQAAHQQLRAAQHAETVKRETELLLQARPEWRDPVKQNEAVREIGEVGKTYGFSTDEIAQVLDHRMLLVLADAAAYRKLKETQPAVTKKVAAAPVALKPGAKPAKPSDQVARQQQMAKLKKSGRIEDAIDLLFR